MRNVRHLRPEDLRGSRWRGYVRESSADQADKWSPERQRADIIRSAEELSLRRATEPLWYTRTGSGEKMSPELARALSDAKAGAFDVLMVYTTSRFARNRAESVRMKAEFRKAGIPIYFVAERMISGSRGNGLLEGVKEVVDEEENETRRQWIAGGVRERMLSGRWHGRLPYGYRSLLVDFPDGRRGWDGALEIDPEQAVIVRRVFDAFAAGAGTRDIAHDLNTSGVAGPAGPWSHRSLSRLIRNPVYKGTMSRYRWVRPAKHYYPEDDDRDGRQESVGAVPAIVSPTLWDQTQGILDRNRTGRPGGSRRTYPLSSILRCASCGGRMTGAPNGTTRYYRCAKRAQDRSCMAPLIRAELAEGTFAEWIGSLQLPADWRSAIAMTREAPAEDTGRRERGEERLTRLRNLYTWGELDDDAFRSETAKVRESMVETTVPSVASMADIAGRLADLGSWSRATPGAQAAVARLMLREIVVEDATVVALVARAEIKPLLDLCVPTSPCLLTEAREYTLRFSA